MCTNMQILLPPTSSSLLRKSQFLKVVRHTLATPPLTFLRVARRASGGVFTARSRFLEESHDLICKHYRAISILLTFYTRLLSVDAPLHFWAYCFEIGMFDGAKPLYERNESGQTGLRPLLISLLRAGYKTVSEADTIRASNCTRFAWKRVLSFISFSFFLSFFRPPRWPVVLTSFLSLHCYWICMSNWTLWFLFCNCSMNFLDCACDVVISVRSWSHVFFSLTCRRRSIRVEMVSIMTSPYFYRKIRSPFTLRTVCQSLWLRFSVLFWCLLMCLCLFADWLALVCALMYVLWILLCFCKIHWALCIIITFRGFFSLWWHCKNLWKKERCVYSLQLLNKCIKVWQWHFSDSDIWFLTSRQRLSKNTPV